MFFQGDSITDMGRGRTEDPNHILGYGYAFLIAPRHGAAYPERAMVFHQPGRQWRHDSRLAARHRAALAHYQRFFDEALRRVPAFNWIRDGICPSHSGHQLMADEWPRVYADCLIAVPTKTAGNPVMGPKP